MCRNSIPGRKRRWEQETQTGSESGPEGANQFSPGREPWVGGFLDTEPVVGVPDKRRCSLVGVIFSRRHKNLSLGLRVRLRPTLPTLSPKADEKGGARRLQHSNHNLLRKARPFIMRAPAYYFGVPHPSRFCLKPAGCPILSILLRKGGSQITSG